MRGQVHNMEKGQHSRIRTPTELNLLKGRLAELR